MTRASLETDPSAGPGRYELKLVFDGLSSGAVRSLIRGHSYLFKEVYPPRQVNNIYFDSADLKLRDIHIQGAFQRYKIRLRWYHDIWSFAGSQLEIKSKTGPLGLKVSFPISQEIDLGNHSWSEILNMIKSGLDPEGQNLIGGTHPVLINRYQREYYQSADRLIRITLDTKLQALDQTFGTRPNLSFYLPMRNLCILEIKADGRYHLEVARVLEEFPQYSSAMSKYINGTETIIH
jgi:hypothetical protein